jgi:outer membrane protein
LILVTAFISDAALAADLMQIYQEAKSHDPVLEAARYRRDAVRQKLPQARAGLLPTLNLTGRTDHTSADVSFDRSPQIDRNVNSHQLKLELTQPLLRRQNWLSYTQADLQVAQAELQFTLAHQESMLRTSQAYFDVLAAQDVLAVAEKQSNAMQAQLDLVTRGRQAGTAAVTDVYEARSRSDLAKAQVIAATNDLEIKRSALEQIVGVVTEKLAVLRVDVHVPAPNPVEPATWISAAREQSYPVRIQQAAIEIAEREIERNRAGHWPSLDFVASKSKDYSSGSVTSPTDLETRSNSTVVGVQLSLPLYAGGAINAKVSEAQSLMYQARADLETIQRNAAYNVRQAYAGVVNGLAQIDAMEQAVLSSKSAVEGNRIGYRVGTRINVDVLNAEQQLYSAERDLSRARYETIMQTLRLKAAIGQLEESDLAVINRFLEMRE